MIEQKSNHHHTLLSGIKFIMYVMPGKLIPQKIVVTKTCFGYKYKVFYKSGIYEC